MGNRSDLCGPSFMGFMEECRQSFREGYTQGAPSLEYVNLLPGFLGRGQ